MLVRKRDVGIAGPPQNVSRNANWICLGGVNGLGDHATGGRSKRKENRNNLVVLARIFRSDASLARCAARPLSLRWIRPAQPLECLGFRR
jgi:hypothetical protein